MLGVCQNHTVTNDAGDSQSNKDRSFAVDTGQWRRENASEAETDHEEAHGPGELGERGSYLLGHDAVRRVQEEGRPRGKATANGKEPTMEYLFPLGPVWFAVSPDFSSGSGSILKGSLGELDGWGTRMMPS